MTSIASISDEQIVEEGTLIAEDGQAGDVRIRQEFAYVDELSSCPLDRLQEIETCYRYASLAVEIVSRCDWFQPATVHQQP